VKTSSILEPLLEIADSSMTHRRRYFAQPQLPTVLDLLLLDTGNPRSLAFQLNALSEHAANLPRDPRAPAILAEQRRISRMIAKLRGADLASICWSQEGTDAGTLPPWLTEFHASLVALSDELTHYYFSHTVARVS
jgi:uncharacterized alpha-E superfamily protein